MQLNVVTHHSGRWWQIAETVPRMHRPRVVFWWTVLIRSVWVFVYVAGRVRRRAVATAAMSGIVHNIWRRNGWRTIQSGFFIFRLWCSAVDNQFEQPDREVSNVGTYLRSSTSPLTLRVSATLSKSLSWSWATFTSPWYM